MKSTEGLELRRFFGVGRTGKCNFYLPVFRGATAVEGELGSPSLLHAPPLQYGGETFADRDAKAAFHVASLLSREISAESIHWEKATAYRKRQRATTFLFGSRSNPATRQLSNDAA